MASFIPPYVGDNILTGVASSWVQPYTLSPAVNTTLSTATIVGATTISTTVVIPIGRQITIDPTGSAETRLVTASSGAGPYTSTVSALTAPHAAGVAVIAPSGGSALLPPQINPAGTPWGAPWTPLGASDTGLEFGFTRKTNDITIEEQVVKVDVVTTDISFDMNITLSEDTLQTMKLAYGGGTITSTAASTGVPGTEQLQISSDMQPYAFGFEVINQYGFWRRFLVPKVKSVATVKTMYSRAKQQRTYAVSFQSLVAPEAVLVLNMTSAAL